jgi:hypothetical protein
VDVPGKLRSFNAQRALERSIVALAAIVVRLNQTGGRMARFFDHGGLAVLSLVVGLRILRRAKIAALQFLMSRLMPCIKRIVWQT